MQNVSMLDQPCPTQSERSQSPVPDVSVLPSRTETVSPFDMRPVRRQHTGPWLKPLIDAVEAETRTVVRGAFAWPMVKAPTVTASQFSVIIHLPRIEGAQPKTGSAKWC